MAYLEDVLVKLRRTYGKDEYVSYLLNRFKESQVEIGKLKSERDEAIYLLERFKNIDQATRSRFGQMQLSKNMKSEIKSLREQNRKLKIDNQRLIENIAKLQI